MRTKGLLAIALLLTLSGCAARWTVFGHSMGGSAPVDTGSKPADPAAVALPATTTSPASTAQIPEATTPTTTAPRPASAAELPKIKSVKVTFTPTARDKVAAEPRFTEDGLVAAITGELRAQKLLDESGAGAGDTLEILIDDFVIHTTSNAVIFGYVLSSGTLKGHLEVLAPDGKPLRNSRIQARSSLTKPAGADQANFFEPLYKGFADLTARNLTGAPEPVAVNH
jgi:hypothetical protein